ncbi:MAG: permease [Paracoccaceae bacterium]
MTDITNFQKTYRSIDKAVGSLCLIFLVLLIWDLNEFISTFLFMINALLGTAPFIIFAVLAVAYLKATSAENLLSKAFSGPQLRMIFLAALLGGLSPFCSCEVIPFIAALLAIGAPLSAVMAFWLSSPLMDPAMFLITSGTLGWDFAVGKTIFSVGIGVFGGFITMIFHKSSVFLDPLRDKPQIGGCCGVKEPFVGTPVWKFWKSNDRLETFKSTTTSNAFFLLKWLALAYSIEALMIKYIPADLIVTMVGGEEFLTILSAAILGAPAYLNGYAAVPLVDALLSQGMSIGAAMSFMIAGGVSSIPAAIAVWALVKPKVFAAYLFYGIVGATLSGLIWQLLN